MTTTRLWGGESAFLLSDNTVPGNNGGESAGYSVASTTSVDLTIQNTIARNGGHALRMQIPSGSLSSAFYELAQPNSSGVYASLHRSFRFALYVVELPSNNAIIAWQFDGSNVVDSLILHTDGKLSVARNTTIDATSTNALSVGTWYLIQYDSGWNGGNGRRVYVATPGNTPTEWASIGTTASSARQRFRVGVTAATTTSIDVVFDDIVVDDSTIGTDLWDDWRVIWLPAISDGTITNWTAGAGGTTNLYQAVDNIPPVGLATPTNTSQIKSVSNTGTASYTANLQTYSDAGIGASDTIHAVQAVIMHGEAVSTGTKTGTVALSANPLSGSVQSFQYGLDAGALADFATAVGAKWFGAAGPVSVNPSVTLGSSPAARIVKTDTGTREADVSWLGAYVAYTPAPVVVTPRPIPAILRQAVKTASLR